MTPWRSAAAASAACALFGMRSTSMTRGSNGTSLRCHPAPTRRRGQNQNNEFCAASASSILPEVDPMKLAPIRAAATELSLRVFVKQEGRWRVAAFHNTLVR